MKRAALPIDAVLPQVAAALRAGPALTISAPPGSGKTTRVPAALLEWVDGGVLVLEPRRLAARAAARRVADELGSRLGDLVGYEVRDDRRVSRATRLRFLTEGVLVQRLLRDPFLEGVDAVVLDEFHERHVETDLALSMLREVRETVRDDLRVIVMSATLDVEPIRAFLAPCGHVAAEGSLHEVRIEHLDGTGDDALRRAVVQAFDAGRENAGDVLVFLPGMREIRRAARDLERFALTRDVDVLPLHGSLPAAEQDRAIRPGRDGRRKIVLATNVAESSLTIDGVTAVVDTGTARILRHDPSRGLDVLRTERISLASARQRAGRAGRTAPGVCYRLWSRAEERGMPEFDAPEITRVDLVGPSLLIRVFAGRDPREFGWFEAPQPAALARADELLRDLDLVDAAGGATADGVAVAGLPLHPRLGRMLIEARRVGASRAIATIAAILSERELVRLRDSVDIEDHFARLEDAERRGLRRSDCESLGLDHAVARSVIRMRDRLLRGAGSGAARRDAESSTAVARCVLHGFPDRVVRMREPGLGQLVGGRGVTVRDPALSDVELLVALRIDDGARDVTRSRVSLALHVERSCLASAFPAAVVEERVAEFDAGRGQIVAVRRTRYRDLVLDERTGGRADPAEAEAMLAVAVRRDPYAHLGEQKSLLRFLRRLAWLRDAEGEGSDLPRLGDADVAEAAAQLAPGKRALRDFRGAPVLALLEQRLTHAQRERLRREAPERIDLSNGRQLRVDYEPVPHVASRLQDFFGVPESPRLAGGRVPLTLHLLAPNRRPVQITADLASFWATVYPKVRSELRNRYPRHAWPEDPLASKPDRPGARSRRR